MSRDFITFRSITPAQQAQRVLHRAGVDTLLQRAPGELSQNGCGYCLRIRRERTLEAVDLLRQAELPFRGVYREENGRWEELGV
jgi:hypothetical protein